jgi:hypothetical protein
MTYKSLPQASPQNKQIQEYVEAAKKGKKSSFIVLSEGGWIVRLFGNSQHSKTFSTKEEAISYAKKSSPIVIFPDNDDELTILPAG